MPGHLQLTILAAVTKPSARERKGIGMKHGEVHCRLIGLQLCGVWGFALISRVGELGRV